MVRKIMTANRAISEAVLLAKPQVIPVYPITPQTTISEYLAQFVADGDLDAEYIKVESVKDTVIIKITVTNKDPETTQKITNAITKVFSKEVINNPEFMLNENKYQKPFKISAHRHCCK